MKKQSQQSPQGQHPSFLQTLKQISTLIQQSQYSKCHQLLGSAKTEKEDQQIEIASLKGYILSLQKKYTEALTLFDQCLAKRPYHLVSKKRRALTLQKLGDYEECIKEFQSCLYFQPESKSIRNKIKRLTMSSAKSSSVSSDCNTFEEKIEKVSKEEGQEEKKPKTQSVKFGNFQIIEIAATEDSDQHFAIIKEQISKLSEKKPKKSILKDSMSASIFKEKPKQKQLNAKQEQKLENAEQKALTPKVEKQKQYEKPTLKKKARSVTFKGDTNLQDFN